MAEVLAVDVIEYMGYENGRNMLNYAQMKKLASLYHIDVIEILRNDEEVTLYDVANSDTDKINIEYFIPKKTLLTRAKEKPILSGTIVGLFVVAILLTVFGIRSNNRPYVSYADNTDRLSASLTSTIYIDSLGAVKGTGDNSNGQISNLPSEHAIKVSEGSNFSVILMEDGTVTSTGLIDKYQKEIAKWTNIVDIACGSNHIVGVDNKGHVHYVGDNSDGQCDLSDFSNIKNIYCLPRATIGVDNSGNILYAGKFVGTKTLKKYSNILDVEGNEDNLIVLKEDGTCDYIASYDDSIYLSILDWKDIIDVTCGKDFFAGLKADGTVKVASLTLNEDEVESWTKMIAIDSGDDYLIGFDGENIKGVGKNFYHQFESNETLLQTLPKVKNIIVDYDNSEVLVRFDNIENAVEYEVSLIIDDKNIIKTKVKDNEIAKFDTNALTDNNYYEIGVVAIGDNKVYGNSIESRVDFIFIKEVEEISEEKIKVRSNLVGIYKGDFEEYLTGIGVNDITGTVSENPCSGSIETVEEITKGITPGATYTITELNARKVEYTYCKLVVEELVEE